MNDSTHDLAVALTDSMVEAIPPLLSNLNEKQRRALRPVVAAHGVDLRDSARPARIRSLQAFRLAQVGVEVKAQAMSAARAYAIDLRPPHLPEHDLRAAQLIKVLRDRAPSWLAQLPEKLATSARTGWHYDTVAAVVERLCREFSIPRPVVTEFLRTLNGGDLDYVCADPDLLRIYPQLLIAGLWRPDAPSTTAELCRRGAVDRRTVIDALSEAAIAGQDSHEAKHLNAVLSALEVTATEISRDLRTWVAMVTVATGSTAKLALTHLMNLDSQAALEPEIAAEVIERILDRGEGPIALTALTWAARLVRTDESARAIIVSSLASRAEHPHRATRDKVSELLGEEHRSGAVADNPDVHVAASGPLETPLIGELAPPPPPIEDLDELVEFIAARPRRTDLAFHDERLIDGIARIYPMDPAGFWQRLDQLGMRETYDANLGRHGSEAWSYSPVLRRIFPQTALRSGMARVIGDLANCSVAKYCRATELGRQLHQPRQLLATPTSLTGHIAPEVVIDRLRQHAQQKLAALPSDLEQCVLRLPRRLPDDWWSELAAVRTPDARRINALLEGLTEPVMVETVAERQWPKGLTTPGVRGRWDLTAFAEIGKCLSGPESMGPDQTQSHDVGIWMSTPSHREAAASAMSQLFAPGQSIPDFNLECVPMLGRLDGPFGLASATVLAIVVNTRELVGVRLATDALVSVAAQRAQVDAVVVGSWWGRWLEDWNFKAGRFARVIMQTHEAGASELAAGLGLGMLRTALPQLRRRAGIGDLIGATADAASASGVRGSVPGLSPIAESAGASLVVRQAERLRTLLASSPEDAARSRRR